MRMVPLWRRGDTVREGAIIHSGPVRVCLPECEPSVIEGAGQIVGALEYFLQAPSMFDIAVPESEKPHTFPLDHFAELILEYDFGFRLNTFVSELLEIANGYERSVAKRLSSELRKYKVRSIHYAQLIEELVPLAQLSTLHELAPVLASARAGHLYDDGLLFAREHRFAAIKVFPEPLKEFVESYKKNAAICREGAPSDSMFILLEGQVAVTKGGKYVASISTAGEAFGELSLFLRDDRTATLIAEKDTKIFVLKESNLRPFYRRHRDVFLNIGMTLARRIADGVQRGIRFTSMIEDAAAIEGDSWKQIRTLHDDLVRIQRRTANETLKHVLSKHSVV